MGILFSTSKVVKRACFPLVSSPSSVTSEEVGTANALMRTNPAILDSSSSDLPEVRRIA